MHVTTRNINEFDEYPSLLPVTVIANYSSATCLEFAQLGLESVILKMCLLISTNI